MNNARGTWITDAPSVRFALIAPAAVSLLAGLGAGLGLADAPAPVDSPRLEGAHGMLMTLGFLGTLIALERAVALRHPAAFAAPGLLGAGGLALVLPMPPLVGQLLLVAGCIGLVGVYAALYRRSDDDIVLAEGLAAMFALVAAALWLVVELPDLTPWLVSFLVLTIAAERVELARIAMPAHASGRLVALSLAITLALVLDLVVPRLGRLAFGLVLLVLVAWLVRHDVARRTIRSRGLPRFSAAALLAGYGWLVVAGMTWSAIGLGYLTGASTADAPDAARPQPGATAYEVGLHTAFIGFALSMVIAHAPVILPAVLRRALPYRPIAWLPLIALHAALALRIGAALIDGLGELWRVGIIATVVAVLLFVLTSALTSFVAGVPRSSARLDRAARPAGSGSTDEGGSTP